MNESTNRYDLHQEQDREDRRKHLDLISAVIGRMSAASAAAKGWAVTVVAAAFGAGTLKDQWLLYVCGLVVLAVFLYLDLRYLETEKRFRDLYDAVLTNVVPPLSMDTRSAAPSAKNPSYKSWSIWGMYVPLFVLGVTLLIASAART